MRSTYDRAMMQGVFPHEGGYTNHPSDPGGPTNWGITIIDARKYWKPTATAADVNAMPKTVAQDIYRAHYALPLRYNDLPAGLDYAVLDYGINSGIARAGKVLRRVCGLPDNDWHVTPDVIAAVNARDPKQLITAICDERLRFLKSLKTWPTFGPGWGRRVAEVKALALHFATEQTAALPQVTAPPITATHDTEVMAKGTVPEAKNAKKAVVAGPAAGAAGAGVTWSQWVAGHPWETGLMVATVVVAIGVAIHFINKARAIKQEAPTPGLAPVPVAA